MRITRYSRLLALMLLPAMLCFSGCGKNRWKKQTQQPSASTSVSGTASKGPIRSGTIRIYAVYPGGVRGALIHETRTDEQGGYRADISPYAGPIVVEAFGDYLDEATGRTMTITPDAPLRAASPSATGDVKVAVSPLTELAVRLAADLTPAGIEAANLRISEVFGFDIIDVQPVEPQVSSLFSGYTSQSQIDYTLALAGFSQMGNGSSAGSVLDRWSAELSGGSVLSEALAAAFQDALTKYLDSGNPNNHTGASPDDTNLRSVGKKTVLVRMEAFSEFAAGNTLISGVELTLELPAGATVRHDRATGEVLDASLTIGAAAPVGALLKGKYSSVASVAGTVKIVLISTAPFTTGEFSVVSVDAPPATVPVLQNFSITGLKFVGASGVALNGLSARISLTVK
jgi:hypothetical protein